MKDGAMSLNGDCHAGTVDQAKLDAILLMQGEAWQQHVIEHCPHLFAAVSLYVSAAQMMQMRAVIAAVENVVALPGWSDERGEAQPAAKGVFYGYDFHLNEQGAHLIEINTNAGGGFLNALLLGSQCGITVEADLERIFLEMFRNEWWLACGAATLNAVAIVDEQPEAQYLYPEFVLAQRVFQRGGIAAHIADPSALQARDDGLYLGGQKIDLVYNRLTDFSLHRHPALRQAYLEGTAVVTPNPVHYARYADKRNLVRLSDADGLRVLGAGEADIAVLLAGVPQTRTVHAADHELWWQERKQWFFKPATGYGGKGSYSGAKLTRRVFEEIMHGGYVAQRMAAPGVRAVCLEGAEPALLKSDVRCYVYDGQVQLVAARMYQGQTTNFRTPGGGFAPVHVVE
jgi:hypothetical protein